MESTTLYDKLWNPHVVTDHGDGTALLYIDRQLLHEVSSPAGFAGMRMRGLPLLDGRSTTSPTSNRSFVVSTASCCGSRR